MPGFWQSRDQGKTHVIGVSNFDGAQLKQAAKEIVSLQPPCSVLW
jgi:diketogulonate reductase-like aldo/keto reductase